MKCIRKVQSMLQSSRHHHQWLEEEDLEHANFSGPKVYNVSTLPSHLFNIVKRMFPCYSQRVTLGIQGASDSTLTLEKSTNTPPTPLKQS